MAFGFAEMQVVSFADLYAGKIVAAFDRQHPRDLFDVRDLLANEGVSDELRRALRESMPDMREQHRTMKRLHRSLEQELVKPTPDRGILEKQLADIRAQMQVTQRAVHVAFLDTVLGMPVEERREMIAQMHEARGHMRRHGPGSLAP